MEIHIKIKKVAIYSRKSRPDETEDALQRQLQILIDMAVKNNWEWEIFQEVGSSMSIDEKERPELNELLRGIQAYEYDGILVTDADRLSRDMEHSAYIKKLLTNYGVKLITTTKVYDYNLQEDDLMSDMMAVIAKQEYVNTKKRLLRGKKAAAKEGRWLGRAPMGYKINHETKRLMIDEEHAPTVREIFRLYNDGLSTVSIADQFNFDGILTPNQKPYCKARIGEILKNEAYIGNAVYGKTVQSKTDRRPCGDPIPIPTDESVQIRVNESHPAIITIEEWNKAETIRKTRLFRPVANRIGKKALSGLIKCSLCGETHSFQHDRNNNVMVRTCKTRIYTNNTTYTVCPNQSVQLTKFEELFYREFEKYIEKLDDELDYIKSCMTEENAFEPENEILVINKKINKIDARLKKVQQAFLVEILDEEEAKAEIKLLKQQRSDFEQEIETIRDTPIEDKVDALSNLVAELKAIMNGTSELPTKEINDLLRSLIDRIEYTRIGTKGSPHNPFSIKIVYK